MEWFLITVEIVCRLVNLFILHINVIRYHRHLLSLLFVMCYKLTSPFVVAVIRAIVFFLRIREKTSIQYYIMKMNLKNAHRDNRFYKNQYFEIGEFQRLQNFGVNVCEFCQKFVLTRTFQYKTAHTSR